jgi:hypothetical protein
MNRVHQVNKSRLRLWIHSNDGRGVCLGRLKLILPPGAAQNAGNIRRRGEACLARVACVIQGWINAGHATDGWRSALAREAQQDAKQFFPKRQKERGAWNEYFPCEAAAKLPWF